MKYTLYIIYTALAVMVMAGCKKSDDIDKIFIGKTWYMTSGMIQGQPIRGDELKKFFVSSNTYVLSFATSTMSGSLSSGTTLGATWTADGKSNDMSIRLTDTPTVDNPFDSNLLNILKGVKWYKGDENIITLYADDQNYIGLSEKRSAQSEY